MERILTQEERIRRAEEIYLRRRNLQLPQYKIQNREVKLDTTEPIKSFKLFKRIALQIIICLLLYCIFYLIYDTNFSFSDITISKTEEILNYDINIEEMYKNINTYINGWIHSDEIEESDNVDNGQEQAQDNNDDTNNQEQQVTEPQNQENTEPATPETEEPVEKGEITPETQPTSTEEVSLKDLYSLIVPLQRWLYFF